MMKSSKRNLVLSLVALVAVVAVGLVYFNYPPEDGRNAQGTIGAVKKHQQTQITPADVVLADESQRQVESLFYGNALKDATQLSTMSYGMSSLANQLRAQELAQKQLAAVASELANQTQAVENRSQALAQRSLAMVDALLATEQLAAVHQDLQGMRESLAAKTPLNAMQLENLRSALNAAEQTLAGKLRAQEQSLAHAESALAAFEQSLENRAASLNAAHLEAMQAELQQATVSLEAMSIENRALNAGIRQLQAQMLEHAYMAKAREHLEVAASDLQNRDFASLASRAASLNAVGESLAVQAASLENFALANMKSRLAVSTSEANSLAHMRQMVQAISEDLASRKLNAQNIDNFTASLAAFKSDLESAESALAQRFLAVSQSELAAVQSYMDMREQLASRAAGSNLQVASLASMSLEHAEALAMASNLEGRKMHLKNLAAANQDIMANFAAHLNAVSDAMESRKLSNQSLQAQLNVQAAQLENRAANLGNRAANLENRGANLEGKTRFAK